MDDTAYAAHDALLQRFQDLATQIRQTHAAWREAVRVANFPLQSVLIAREREMLTEASEVLAAYHALIAQRRPG
jgi:hypothetical protein